MVGDGGGVAAPAPRGTAVPMPMVTHVMVNLLFSLLLIAAYLQAVS
jgi:hypothetical protein